MSIVIKEFQAYLHDRICQRVNEQVIYKFPNYYGAHIVNRPGAQGVDIEVLYFQKVNNNYIKHEKFKYVNISRSELFNILMTLKEIRHP